MMNKIFTGLLLCPVIYLHGAEPADSTLRLIGRDYSGGQSSAGCENECATTGLHFIP